MPRINAEVNCMKHGQHSIKIADVRPLVDYLTDMVAATAMSEALPLCEASNFHAVRSALCPEEILRILKESSKKSA